MAKHFSLTKCATYFAVLAALFGLSKLYAEPLYNKSHEVILNLQQAHLNEDGTFTDTTRFMKNFSGWTEDESYILAFLIASVFMSRERFWYYFISMCFASTMKINLKMI